jgi:hypothetical protein
MPKKITCNCPHARVTFPVPLGRDMHTPSCASRKQATGK